MRRKPWFFIRHQGLIILTVVIHFLFINVAAIPDVLDDFLQTDDMAWNEVLDTTISMDLKGADLTHVLKRIAEQSGANIVYDFDSQLENSALGSLHIALKDVTLREFFYIIGKKYDLAITWGYFDGQPHFISIKTGTSKNLEIEGSHVG